MLKKKEGEKKMEIKCVVGKTEILDSELNNQISEIINLLKSKKQTYAVNKFVLEKTIEQLQEVII